VRGPDTNAAAFAARFGRPPAVTASAPGRVNLIGEHTDYNDGFVLPLAVPQRTTVSLAPRPGGTVHAASAMSAGSVVAYERGAETAGRGWVDYVQGLTWALDRRGLRVPGFDLWIDSTVPPGAGLASSAALEVAVLRALRDAFGLALDDLTLAQVGREAESGFVGARVGIMDQMACVLAAPRHALFLDTRDLGHERVALPAGLAVLVIDSGVRHRHADGGYNARREECERACALLGVRALRDITPADGPRVAALPEPLGRRVRHVVTENARVLAAVAALRAGDAARLGELLRASHASLRDDFAVSVPPLDRLVEAACAEPGVVGARLTGGGFGGAVVAVVAGGDARAVAARVAARAGPGAVALVPV
jgi:galactokinase